MVKALQATTASLRSQIAQLKTGRIGTSPNYTEVPSPVPESPTAKNAVKGWRYTYEFGLIGYAGKGRMKLRYSDGTRTKIRYSYENYATDRMFFSGNFLNKSNTTAKFQFQVFLATPTGNLGMGPKYKVVGRKMVTTPYLAPGEVHQFDVDVPVSTIRKVSIGGIGNVRAFDLNGP
jgi:hypothetical protein